MERITAKDLEHGVKMLNDLHPEGVYSIRTGYGRVGLDRKDGAVNVSALMSKRDLNDFIHAYILGLTARREF